MTFFKMRRFKGYLILIFGALVIFNIYILLSGKTYFYNAVYHNFADIDDYKIFPNRVVKASEPQPWPVSTFYNKASISPELREVLTGSSSVAFLIIKDDSLVHEQYWDNYGPDSYSNSFSVAKSFISALIGIALKEGKIKSVEQYVGEFIPEFNEDERRKIKIKHLLTMSSGLDWNEAYADPLSVTTEAYYGNDLWKIFKDIKVAEKPGKKFEYKSGDTQVLGFILEKATGMSISQYAEKKLWQPMGAVHDALWSLDKENGHEKAYCCINSNARDLARLGYLYLHKGNWKGKQLIDTAYVEASLKPNSLLFEDGEVDFYGYQWWTIPDYKGHNIFYARGILGQMVIVIPDMNIVVVRLGENRGEKERQHFGMVFRIVDEITQ
jgi:CubicO group peptidase (beta-lactamase class C family)